MVFDSEIAGDGDVQSAPISRHAPTKRRFHKSPAIPNQRASAEPTTKHDEQCEDDCLVCQRPSQGEPFGKQWRNGKMHRHCWNGVRCYLRAQRTKEAKDQEVALFYKNFETWRRAVLPLVVFDGGPRSVKTRAELQGVSNDLEDETTEVYEDHHRIRDTKLMVKSHFKARQKSLEGWLSDEASDEFEKQLGLQSGEEEDSDGNPRIRAKLSEVIRVTKGRRSVRRKASSRDTRGASTRGGIDGDSGSDMSMPHSSTKRPRHSRSPGARSVSSRMVTPMGKMRDTGDSGLSASCLASPLTNRQRR